ncbi:MAG: DUF2723 domain-containing protein [Bacteroidales bacterium]
MNSSYRTFRLWNNITGWVLFLVATITYTLTLEPTVSFWDCGEFILSAFRLQVGHPPGAPLFLMMGRVASLFAGSDTSKVAFTINMMSAISSGLTIMFLFWTITHLVRKVYSGGKGLETSKIPVIIAAGILGSLAYTFSDTFWFSAVEGEVYALSSLVTGFVFWGMLKWEDEADKPYSGRWIILIAYVMGLGIGIHRLNLLVIPVLVFVYYFKKFEVTARGLIKTFLLSVFLLWLVVFVIMPGIPTAAGWIELVFVNTLGLPYNSGLYFYLVLVVAGLVYGMWYSIKKGKVILNYVLTILTVIFIGYSSYAMIMIRSAARPPMNQNDPSDVFSFIYYINMEQYGSNPKFYGNYYSAPLIGSSKKVAGYNKVNGRYEPYYRIEYKYSKQFETLFPRMYSQEPDHEEAYKYWGKIKGRKYSIQLPSGTKKTVVKPTFGENLRFFFRYHVGYMYMRYFMWNYAGRQNDIQGNGNPLYGNWVSGIGFIDNARLGDMSKMPEEILTNKAHNTYFLLPFLLGLAGMFWHYRKSRNDFWLVMGFFFMTGLAIVLYLNQYPNQPRERDYAYAGSFYAFAIWIGLGLMYIYELLVKVIPERVAQVTAFVILLLAVPVRMASQNWDDHDRSGRYTARDIGAIYLKSTDKNAILFTYGDNDSFPLWYCQDVEGIRTDVRVANLSYIQAGWYIEMMKQKAFDSDPLPITLDKSKYIEGKRNQLPIDERVVEPVEIRKVVDFAALDDKNAMVDISGNGDLMNYIPAKKFRIDVDRNTVLSNGTVKPYFADSIVSPMIWDYTETDAFKGDLAIMDMFSTMNWSRPMYFSTTVPSAQYKGLEKYFVQEGLAYRVVPIKTGKPEQGEYGIIDPQEMYNNLMNKFEWGNAADPGVYLDENNRRMFGNFRRLFGSLGKRLLEVGDTTRALEVARRGLEIVPESKLPYDYFVTGIAETFIRAGHAEEGLKIIDTVIKYSTDYLAYAVTLKGDKRFGMDYPIGLNMQTMIEIYRMSEALKLTDLMKKIEPDVSRFYSILYTGSN